MTDSELIDHFVSLGDVRAFGDIVARHGPRVLRVCRRVLSKPEDVEDAYQATFLVLIQKAPALHDSTALSSWLHGVAHKTSMRMQRDAARRRRLENQSDRAVKSFDDPPHSWDDSSQTLHEELAILPEDYRVPLELCYLQGRSHEQAASQLGWPLGTLKTRVGRGRQRLFDRLTRRGVTIGAWLLWWLWPRSTSKAASTCPQDPSIGTSGLESKAADQKPPTPARSKYRRLDTLASLLFSVSPLWYVLGGLVTTYVVIQLHGSKPPDPAGCGCPDPNPVKNSGEMNPRASSVEVLPRHG